MVKWLVCGNELLQMMRRMRYGLFPYSSCEQTAKTRASATTQGMHELEPLKAVASLYFASHGV
jgi:hypothetical protein